jgi:hypothetical protein
MNVNVDHCSLSEVIFFLLPAVSDVVLSPSTSCILNMPQKLEISYIIFI